jgi:hypothetical protein
MTEALAIIGAVTGVTGTVLAIAVFVRDRAKLEVTHVASVSRYDPEPGDAPEDALEEGPGLVIFIANHGRQPIAVTDAGITTQGKRSILQKFRHLTGARPEQGSWSWFVLDHHSDSPVVLGLGELRKYDMPRGNLRMLLGTKDVNLPLFSFAVDSRGRTTMSSGPVPVDFLRSSETSQERDE